MKTGFKLVGLSGSPVKSQNIVATCEVEPKHQSTFTAQLQGTIKRKQALWDYYSQNLDDPKIAVVEHSGYDNHGFPINPIIIAIIFIR